MTLQRARYCASQARAEYGPTPLAAVNAVRRLLGVAAQGGDAPTLEDAATRAKVLVSSVAGDFAVATEAFVRAIAAADPPWTDGRIEALRLVDDRGRLSCPWFELDLHAEPRLSFFASRALRALAVEVAAAERSAELATEVESLEALFTDDESASAAASVALRSCVSSRRRMRELAGDRFRVRGSETTVSEVVRGPGEEFVDVVLSRPPGPTSDFVELELPDGSGVNAGQWIEDGGTWRLRITRESFDAALETYAARRAGEK